MRRYGDACTRHHEPLNLPRLCSDQTSMSNVLWVEMLPLDAALLIYPLIIAVLLLVYVSVARILARGRARRLHNRRRDLSSIHAFSASTQVRALETTRLAYIAPIPANTGRTLQPVILRTFERAGGNQGQR